MTGVELPLAHAGHWLTGVAYALPVILVPAAIAVVALIDRRRQGGEVLGVGDNATMRPTRGGPCRVDHRQRG